MVNNLIPDPFVVSTATALCYACVSACEWEPSTGAFWAAEENGFTEPSGSQSFNIFVTDVQLALYRKARTILR